MVARVLMATQNHEFVVGFVINSNKGKLLLHTIPFSSEKFFYFFVFPFIENRFSFVRFPFISLMNKISLNEIFSQLQNEERRKEEEKRI